MNAPTLITLALAIIPLAFACKWVDRQIVRHFRIRRRLGLR